MPSFPPTGLPTPRHFVALADSFIVTSGSEYQDGGVDTFWGGGSPVKRWECAYDNLTVAERAIVTTFIAAVRGTHGTFTMTWRDGTVYSNCKLEVTPEAGHADRPLGYYTGHFCTFRIIRRP